MKSTMLKGIKFLAILLFLSGVLGLVYHGFTYTTQTRKAEIGTLELSVNEKHTVDIPVEASVAAIVIGAGVLIWVVKKR